SSASLDSKWCSIPECEIPMWLEMSRRLAPWYPCSANISAAPSTIPSRRSRGARRGPKPPKPALVRVSALGAGAAAVPCGGAEAVRLGVFSVGRADPCASLLAMRSDIALLHRLALWAEAVTSVSGPPRPAGRSHDSPGSTTVPHPAQAERAKSPGDLGFRPDCAKRGEVVRSGRAGRS